MRLQAGQISPVFSCGGISIWVTAYVGLRSDCGAFDNIFRDSVQPTHRPYVNLNRLIESLLLW